MKRYLSSSYRPATSFVVSSSFLFFFSPPIAKRSEILDDDRIDLSRDRNTARSLAGLPDKDKK